MANTKIAYQEVRFIVEDPQITEVYVRIKNVSQDGFPVGGWYHKTFPARIPTIQLLTDMFNGNDDPVLWAQKYPEK